MQDMLCSLLELPPMSHHLEKVFKQGYHIRRVNPWEKTKLTEFVAKNFSQGWADELEVAFHHQPVSCYVVLKEKEIVGFAAYECTRKNYFGPTGVIPAHERKGLGSALLLAALYGLRELGYTYAVIGAVSSVEYYAKLIGAIPIPLGDGKGIYTQKNEAGLLR